MPPALPVDAVLPSPQLMEIEEPAVELSVRVTVRLLALSVSLTVGWMFTVTVLERVLKVNGAPLPALVTLLGTLLLVALTTVNSTGYGVEPAVGGYVWLGIRLLPVERVVPSPKLQLYSQLPLGQTVAEASKLTAPLLSLLDAICPVN